MGISTLRKNPVIYEINTWVWLGDLIQRMGRSITLGEIPQEEWKAIAALPVDAVWLMGVWERSPSGIRIAMDNPNLVESFRRALPNFRLEDVAGSPYCIRGYRVDDHLGGAAGLAAARQALAERGVRLILDYVPNHVAPDHPWVREHPEYFVRGDADDLEREPQTYFEANGQVIARGRDPYYPPWLDVAQLNAFHPGLRRAALRTLREIAAQCDGVRCDMAMLSINEVFEGTWGRRAGERPSEEYWPELIRTIKGGFPGFTFIAEAYWDLEWTLQQQGFDFCYDKRLYDRLEKGTPESVRLHLLAGLDYQDRLVRFIENHDEPRAASVFESERLRAAAIAASTLPGGRLFHEGQFEGRQVRLPVFLGRRPDEPVAAGLPDFYARLLKAVDAEVFHTGEWQLCPMSGWPDNNSFQNLVAWCWRAGAQRRLIIINLSAAPAQAQVSLVWEDLPGQNWRLVDPIQGESFDRNGDDLGRQGLFVSLPAWGFHFLTVSQFPE
jgi:hypothetical protein